MLSEPTVARRKRRTCGQWCKKYFCAGQIKAKHIQEKPTPDPSWSWFYTTFVHFRPHWVTVLGPLCLVWITWSTIMTIWGDQWKNFSDSSGIPGWYMSLTMVAGSFIAGATSEGGGSIAYPVMTLVLGLDSSIARDFSLMIQSIGMTAAAFSVIYSEITVEKTALIWGTVGGSFGIIVGLMWIDPLIPSEFNKMIFVSVWLAFAINLFLMNRRKKRFTRLTIMDPTWHTKLAISCVGFVGGILSGMAGSGLDICAFSILTLYYRVTEKTATPTSVVLMGINTVLGFAVRVLFFSGDSGIATQSWQFWSCAAPVVVLGAPCGAFVSSFLHRQVLASFVYITDTTQFIMACIITDLTPALKGTTTAAVLGGIIMFRSFVVLGVRKLEGSKDYETWLVLNKGDHSIQEMRTKETPIISLGTEVIEVIESVMELTSIAVRADVQEVPQEYKPVPVAPLAPLAPVAPLAPLLPDSPTLDSSTALRHVVR